MNIVVFIKSERHMIALYNIILSMIAVGVAFNPVSTDFTTD